MNSSTINNLQVVDVIEDGGSKVTHVITYAHQLKMHLEELKKQCLVYKSHNCNSPIWVFFQSKQQPTHIYQCQLDHRCIIFHNHMCGLKIIALHMRCCKGLITYFKITCIVILKKHLAIKHKTLLAKYLKHVGNQLRSTHDREPTSKRFHITPIALCGFFVTINPLTKDHFT